MVCGWSREPKIKIWRSNFGEGGSKGIVWMPGCDGWGARNDAGMVIEPLEAGGSKGSVDSGSIPKGRVMDGARDPSTVALYRREG